MYFLHAMLVMCTLLVLAGKIYVSIVSPTVLVSCINLSMRSRELTGYAEKGTCYHFIESHKITEW